MKLLKHVLDFYIYQIVNIDKMQYGCVPDRGTTDAIFVVRKLQKCIAANKQLNFAFIDLGKDFHRVPRKVLWWALRSLNVKEGAVSVSPRACTPMPEAVCWLIVSTVGSFA